MALGPVEFLALKFPEERIPREVVEELTALVNGGTIRIIDVLVARKSADGDIRVIELSDLDPETLTALDPLVDDIMGLISESDVRQMAASMESGSSAGFLLYENTWATRFRDAVVNTRGEVLFHERLPRSVVDSLLASAAEAQGTLAS
ncbi:MAG: hypothetical protein JO352_16835 [Chloroflexi bacterium]|nr:hypothetical protein [Chloroflexota bacterium]